MRSLVFEAGEEKSSSTVESEYQLSSTLSCSSSSLDTVRTKFRPKFEVQHRSMTKPQHTQTHTRTLSLS